MLADLVEHAVCVGLILLAGIGSYAAGTRRRPARHGGARTDGPSRRRSAELRQSVGASFSSCPSRPGPAGPGPPSLNALDSLGTEPGQHKAKVGDAYYRVGWRLDGRGRPADGWGPWQKVPG